MIILIFLLPVSCEDETDRKRKAGGTEHGRERERERGRKLARGEDQLRGKGIEIQVWVL